MPESMTTDRTLRDLRIPEGNPDYTTQYGHGWNDAIHAALIRLPSEPPAVTEALQAVADIVKRHTHQNGWAMTRYAGKAPEEDCLLCRALVAAGMLTVDQIGAGTRAAFAAATPESGAAGEARTCVTCGHRPHRPGECEARYHVTFEPGEAGDPCLCEAR